VIHQSFGQTTTDESGRFTRVDRFICELLGYEARDLLGRSIQDITHPEDWPSNLSLLERLQTHEEPFTITKRYLRSDGSVIWVQAYVTKLRDAEGQGSICAMIRPVLPQMREPERGGKAVPEHGEKTVPEGAGRPCLPGPRPSGWMGRVLH
jgi:PAS domain S-box-containing protein